MSTSVVGRSCRRPCVDTILSRARSSPLSYPVAGNAGEDTHCSRRAHPTFSINKINASLFVSSNSYHGLSEDVGMLGLVVGGQASSNGR
ncbi:BQ5605_C008g04994 [Microbotryum silenes-dioicae]|uniref:BQ5605_C008g04994 protein n=1 Tax=Microbotryum silenes-dioicae TaxID=796604 RepID=A0A2X0P7H4_9BASI|nr:BQ5605_C008g04994 [Microbotryum silenes-dioicae]